MYILDFTDNKGKESKMSSFKALIIRFLFFIYSRKLKGKKVWIIGTPRHGNLGDQAIAEAELQWISQYYKMNDILEISLRYARLFGPLFTPKQVKGVLFVFQGGGNMGVEYFWEEKLRQLYMKRFPLNKMIIMPQTFDYGSTDYGKQMEQESVSIYSQCSDLTICARENYSYKKMKDLYINSSILCLPDIVLSWKVKTLLLKRKGVLFCIRHDKEKYYSDEFITSLENTFTNMGETVLYTDTIYKSNISRRKRKKILLLKLNQIASSKIMVTDRIHGMIFAALTGTPCLVLSNYNYKVKGEYEWIRKLEYVQYLSDRNTVFSLIEYMMKEVCTKEYHYPYLDEEMNCLRDYFENIVENE